MTIKIADPENEGQEIEVFTPAEVEAMKAEKDTALTAAQQDAKTAREEAEKHKRVATEQTQNFKKLNDMTEAEKSALSAEKIESMKRAEKAEADIEALRNERSAETKARVEKDTTDALARYHGGDEKLKAELEKNFKMIAMEGNTTEIIQERARLAAAMYQGTQGRSNPLTSSMSGESPAHVEKSKKDEFMQSDKAKEALRRMG